MRAVPSSCVNVFEELLFPRKLSNVSGNLSQREIESIKELSSFAPLDSTLSVRRVLNPPHDDMQRVVECAVRI